MKMLRSSLLPHAGYSETIANLYLNNLRWVSLDSYKSMMVLFFAKHCSFSYKMKILIRRLAALHFHIFKSLFNQDCIIQVKKKVILQPVSWLLSHGNELVSQLCSCCQLSSCKDTEFMNPAAGSSHAISCTVYWHLFSVLTTIPCCSR